MKALAKIISVSLCLLGFSAAFSQEPKFDSIRTKISLSKNDTNKVILLHELAIEFKNINVYDSAQIYLDSARELAMVLKYEQGLSKNYNYTGLVYINQGNYSKALKNLLSALRIRTKLNDIGGIASCFNNIGTIHRNQGNNSEALKNYFLSINCSQQIHDTFALAAVYNNMGLLYLDMLNYPKSLKCFYKSLEYKKLIGNKKGMANCYNNIGLVYGNMGNYNEALKNFNICLSLMQELHFNTGIETSYINLSGTYLKLNNLKEAKRYGAIAYEMAKSESDLEGIKEVCKSLTSVYEKSGNPAEALKFYKEYELAKDSIANEAKPKEMIKLQMQYEFEAKENLNKLEYQNELSKKEALNWKKNITIIVMLLFIGLIIGFSVILFKRFKLIKSQKKTIEFLFKEVHHRVKNNLQVIGSILSLQKNYIEDTAAKNVFQDCQNRVYSMAKIHEALYLKSSIEKIDLAQYFQNLVSELISTYKTKEHINLELEVGVDEMSIDVLIPLGLIVNEIVSNSLKHAFDGSSTDNKIFFSLKKSLQTYELIIGDNGKGKQQYQTNTKTQASFGGELIAGLVDQISGKMEILSSENGLTYSIQFPAETPRKFQ